MPLFPYRNQSPFQNHGLAPKEKRFDDRAVLTALGLFWAVSLFRVIGGLIRHEVFGAEGTLALLAVCAIPWLIWGQSS